MRRRRRTAPESSFEALCLTLTSISTFSSWTASPFPSRATDLTFPTSEKEGLLYRRLKKEEASINGAISANKQRQAANDCGRLCLSNSNAVPVRLLAMVTTKKVEEKEKESRKQFVRHVSQSSFFRRKHKISCPRSSGLA